MPLSTVLAENGNQSDTPHSELQNAFRSSGSPCYWQKWEALCILMHLNV